MIILPNLSEIPGLGGSARVQGLYHKRWYGLGSRRSDMLAKLLSKANNICDQHLKSVDGEVLNLESKTRIAFHSLYVINLNTRVQVIQQKKRRVAEPSCCEKSMRLLYDQCFVGDHCHQGAQSVYELLGFLKMELDLDNSGVIISMSASLAQQVCRLACTSKWRDTSGSLNTHY